MKKISIIVLLACLLFACGLPPRVVQNVITQTNVFKDGTQTAIAQTLAIQSAGISGLAQPTDLPAGVTPHSPTLTSLPSAVPFMPSAQITPDPDVKTVITGQLPELPPVRIVRHPGPSDFSGLNPHPTVVKFDPNSANPFQIDYRSANLTKLDLSNSLNDLLFANFDSLTKWPPATRMPPGFDVKQIMETGKDPGLGVRFLHDKGITGKGVGIAIIDQALLVDHSEYVNQLRLYEESADLTGPWLESSMHGAAVASIAVGKTVGVAPEADLYFIGTSMCPTGGSNDYSCLAKNVRRIIEINKGLPVNRKIRVLSISVGWMPQDKGYDDIMAAIKEAKADGIFVITTSLAETDGLYFIGLGRDSLADPNVFASYTTSPWWSNSFYLGQIRKDYLLAPMDARTTASPTGANDYVFYGVGGMSWTVPYMAGMYALAVQVKPEITPEEFWTLARTTGKVIPIQHDGITYTLGTILDPQALIAALQK